jgi:hypothetical protein
MTRNHLISENYVLHSKVSFLEKQITRLLAKFLELIVSRAKNDERGSLDRDRERASERRKQWIWWRTPMEPTSDTNDNNRLVRPARMYCARGVWLAGWLARLMHTRAWQVEAPQSRGPKIDSQGSGIQKTPLFQTNFPLHHTTRNKLP